MVYTSRLVVKTVYMPLIRTLRYIFVERFASVYSTTQLKLDTSFTLFAIAHRFYSSHSSILVCYLHVALVAYFKRLTREYEIHIYLLFGCSFVSDHIKTERRPNDK